MLIILTLLACSPTPERIPQQTVGADAYCELSADAFCDYYMRCDRMAEPSHAACRSTFLETCEQVFEPRYVALEQRGELALSADGLATCADHLRTVECEQQVFDLDGACGSVWQGLVEAGGECGLGVESFVCEEQTTCVLGLDFCGTCEPTVTIGSACAPGEARCTDDASCVDGTCIADANVGEACGDEQPCRVGARCSDGLCQTNTVVGLGQACDASRRCQYRAECVDGVCEQAPLLGESCTAALPCASGWCDAGVCAPLAVDGEPCDSPSACVGGQCSGGVCTGTVSSCLTP